jgi:hypothetical protein
MKHFFFSPLTTVIGLILAYMWGKWDGLVIASLLMVMEISLSFDNAVVNAVVLKDMSEKWQQRFLTWGMLIAVFGMRFLFPIVIVSFATGLHIWEVTELAFDNPTEYSRHVLESHIQIAAFGGMFLLMVFFKFLFNQKRDLFWISFIESKLARMGKLESVEVVMALILLLSLQTMLPEAERIHALTAGIVGVVLYVMIHGLTALFASDHAADSATKATGAGGLMAFIYLQFLDASFSLDGVIGAFAMSKDVVIIMIGLGIGAMFVRSLTIYLVRKGTLDEYVFLEHGAHWGIGALAVIMLMSMMAHVPEVVTGLIGVTFIGLSFWSSVRHKKLAGR